MKRSLIASAVLAGLLAIYAPVSQAQMEAGIQGVKLIGQFQAGALLQFGSTDTYGFPVVGYACPDGKKACDNPRSGLLYNPNSVSGAAGAFQLGSATLLLSGRLIRFDNGDYIGWNTKLDAEPFSKASKGRVAKDWKIFYASPTFGNLQIGSGMGVAAFASLRDWYSSVASIVGISDGGLFMIYPGASGQSGPFDYVAPGVQYSSKPWNGMSFNVSIGASIKQHHSLTDKSWANEPANVDGYNNDGAYTTPSRAIQWAVAFNGYFHGIEGFLKPLAGQWMFSYAQSQQLNEPSVQDFKFKRAAHVSFASIYMPLRSVNVVDLQWSQNTGVGVDGGYTQTLLQNLGLQSNFEGVSAKIELLHEDLGQVVKPIPYWNAGVSWTTWHALGGATDMSWSVGYTRTQTYGYDFPGVSLNSLAYVSNSLFNDPRFLSVFEQETLSDVAEYFGVKQADLVYPQDYQLMAGKLIAQSVYVGARYRYISPYFPGLSLTLTGQLVYGKASLQLQGTPEQLAKGYSTKPFALGTDLLALVNLSLNYSF